MKTAVFVQARCLGSTRLPAKMIMPLPGGSVIQHCLRASRKIDADVYSILTTEKDAIYFEYVAKEEGFDITIGPEDDVLKRFVIAIEKYNVNAVVRITGDKAFLSAKYTQMALDLYKEFPVPTDFIYYDGYPLKLVTGGTYSARRMVELDKMPNISKEWREHIRPAFIEKYKCHNIPSENSELVYANNLNLVIDTPEDYEKICDIYRTFYRGRPIEIDELAHMLYVLR